MKSRLRQALLHRRLALSVFRATIGFALLTSAAYFAFELNHAQERAQVSANQLLDTVETTASIAAYADNAIIGDDAIQGLLRHEIIHNVQLESQRTLHLHGGQPDQVPGELVVTRELHSPFGPGEAVGRITITVDANVALREAALQGLLYALNSFLLIGLTGLMVLRLVRTSLSNPLRRLSDAIVAITEGRQQRLEPRHAPGQDEFAVLIDYVNGLLNTLENRYQAEQALKAEVERISGAKSEFLAYLSHELRHPMNVITIAAELAMANDKPDEHRQYLQGIQIATRSMLTILNEVLDFSKFEAGKREIEQIPFQLENVVDLVRQLYSLKARSKGLTLEASCDPCIPARLIGDPVRLGQVLTNLISNALKFTRQGWVRLEARQIASTDRISTVRFSVTDTGTGLSEFQCQRFFEPFEQFESAPDQAIEGTGLGLVISRQLVRLMGGDIAVESQPGRGSTFSFTIDFPLAAEAPPDAPLAEPAIRCTRKRETAKLLLVDDSEINRILAAKLLTVNGFLVDTASSGEEAVERVLHGGQVYCAILMDLMMPGMGGRGAAQRIREHFSPDELPIIALTANVVGAEREQCLAEGFNDFLTKPIELPELARSLRRSAGRGREEPLTD